MVNGDIMIPKIDVDHFVLSFNGPRNILLVHLSFRALHFWASNSQILQPSFSARYRQFPWLHDFLMRSSSSKKKSRQSEHKVRFIHWKDIVGSSWFLGSLAIPLMFGETSYAVDVSEEMIMSQDKSHEATPNNGSSHLFHVRYHTPRQNIERVGSHHESHPWQKKKSYQY